MSSAPLPRARPVPATAVVETGSGSGAWGRGLLHVLGAWSVVAVVWWATGLDVLYGVVVASTAVGALAHRPLTTRTALRNLGLTAALALGGAVTFGVLGVGAGTTDRLLQGAGGVLVAGVVLLVVVGVDRRRSPANRAPT